VLDAFAGTGTTAFVARRLNRRFVAIEQDDDYAQVADRRLSEQHSSWQRAKSRARRSAVSKRALQLELQQLAIRLSRLPTRRDVETLSKYALEVFEEAFSSWGAALKAAKIVAGNSSHIAFAQGSAEQLEIFKDASLAQCREAQSGDDSRGAQSPEEFSINDGSFESSSSVTFISDEHEAADYQNSRG
jgi:hypothetical protein